MSWITDLLLHFGLVRQLPTSEVKRARKQRRTIEKADRVLEDYAKQDAVLRIEVKRR